MDEKTRRELFIRTGDLERVGFETRRIEYPTVCNKGTYDTNNGKVAFVDDNGQIYVGWANAKTLKALIDQGYKRGLLYVPHSNGDSEYLKYLSRN